MKSFLSLVAALVVVGAIGAGGYWLYQQQTSGANSADSGGNAHVVGSISNGASLTLTNGTHYVLTVMMRRETELVRFEIAPGHSQTKSLTGGTYSVEGKISDPKTDPFNSQWDFQPGGKYTANFAVDGKTGQVGMIIRAGEVGNPAASPAAPGKRP